MTIRNTLSYFWPQTAWRVQIELTARRSVFGEMAEIPHYKTLRARSREHAHRIVEDHRTCGVEVVEKETNTVGHYRAASIFELTISHGRVIDNRVVAEWRE